MPPGRVGGSSRESRRSPWPESRSTQARESHELPRSPASPSSPVGTLTEVHVHRRLLFARVGVADFLGSRALKVPFGKHPLESRMKWSGITARPRDEGYYRGLVPTITESLVRNRNQNILRFVRTESCADCGGSRLNALLEKKKAAGL